MRWMEERLFLPGCPELLLSHDAEAQPGGNLVQIECLYFARSLALDTENPGLEIEA